VSVDTIKSGKTNNDESNNNKTAVTKQQNSSNKTTKQGGKQFRPFFNRCSGAVGPET
jgi:hypothetical protein